jgi:hypothetical protein
MVCHANVMSNFHLFWCSWQAHSLDTAILHLSQISSRKLLTVSSDKTAVVWDFASSRPPSTSQSTSFMPWNAPQRCSTIRGLHDPEKTSRSHHTVHVEHFARQKVLFAASGHKVAVSSISDKKESRAEVRSFTDGTTKSKISKNKMFINAIVPLPLRRLVVLGTEEGSIRICV